MPAFQKLTQNPAFTDVLDKRGFGRVYMGPDDFTSFLKENDAQLGKVMKEAGVIK